MMQPCSWSHSLASLSEGRQCSAAGGFRFFYRVQWWTLAIFEFLCMGLIVRTPYFLSFLCAHFSHSHRRMVDIGKEFLLIGYVS